MPSVLITGAGRGLGLEFVRQYAADGWKVFGTVRDPARADALRALDGQISIHALELTEPASIDALVAELRGTPLDVLIANAGVTGPRGMTADLVDRESWLETLHVNCVAPIAIAGAFKPNLMRGKERKAIAISSALGSIAENVSGGFYSYRSSKAALNAAWRSLAIDWRQDQICCTLLTPGWVKTAMGGKQADIEPPESIAGMRRVIAELTMARSGALFCYRGVELPW